MHPDLEKAKALLESEGYTCVLCKGERFHVSRHRGVRPLMELLRSGEDLTDFCAADKVVGKATALLYRLLGVKAVYAGVISDAALSTLKDGGIDASFGEQVPYIVNRTGDGCCPMEAATAHITDPRQAPNAIEQKLKELHS